MLAVGGAANEFVPRALYGWREHPAEYQSLGGIIHEDSVLESGT